VAAQVMPQPPQFAGSLVTSAQYIPIVGPPQEIIGGGQVDTPPSVPVAPPSGDITGTHTAFWQALPAGHAIPHAPQFAES
jgi:hypothetical protein